MKRPSKNLSNDEWLATFDRQQKVMKMFSDNAKTYIQLSGAALTLTLTFAEKILHISKPPNAVNGWMVVMWGCFLSAIISGAFYQYLAAKYLEGIIDWEHMDMWGWVPDPGSIYGVMLLSFYGGSTIFTVYAIVNLNALPVKQIASGLTHILL
jgi:hypothetical protein